MKRPVPESGNLFVRYRDPKSAAQETERFLSSGVVAVGNISDVSLLEGDLWKSEIPRSTGRQAHAWFFARDWYSASSLLSKEETESLLNQLDIAIDRWVEHSSDNASMAFHDETTAQRAMVFTALLHAFEKVAKKNTREKLLYVLRGDLRRLASDDFYAGLNNHGMFQDIALLVAADYGYAGSNKKNFEETAFSRLFHYFKNSFTEDGIHTENNPTYHVMVARYLAQIVEYATSHGHGAHFALLEKLLESADEYAAFSVTPHGDFVPISDTNLRRLTPYTARATFGPRYLLSAVTAGEKGVLPPRNVFVAEKSGYGVVRSGWTSKQDTYLFFNAAYNADYHKHSDELSVYLSARGYEILTESGPNGYQYDDPFTKYAFSSFAHNTMVVDGQGLPRTDDLAHLTTLEDEGSSEAILKVTGRTRRYSGVDWRRSVDCDLRLMDLEGVKIADRVQSDSIHTYKFIWHLGSGIIPFVRGSFIELYAGDTQKKIAEMQWTGSPVSTVRLFHGQRHPRIQGWQFPVMGERKRSYSAEIELEGSSIAIDWIVRLENFVLTDRKVSPFDSDWSTFYGEKPVHYQLVVPDSDSSVDELAVVFSAVNPVGDFTYNHRSLMEKYKGAVLYILDGFGDQGAYHLANGRNLSEFRSVQGLIKTVIGQLGISLSNVATFGSSNGGTSAFLHGVTLGVGNVFSGAPQYRVGSFLKNFHPNVLQYLAGGTSAGDIHWANKIAFDILSSGVRSTHLHVIVGLKDSHYRHHAIPLVDDARALGYKVHFLTIPGSPNSEFGAVFREFVRNWVRSRNGLDGMDFFLPHTTGIEEKTKTLGVAVAHPEGAVLRGQLFRGSERIGPVTRFEGPRIQWQLKEAGSYRARVYVDLPGGGERKAFGTNTRKIN